MIVMQADFTDQPELLPELIKRFEGGADIVIGERAAGNDPIPVRRLRKLAPWAIRFSLGASDLADPFGSFRLFRISLIREITKTDPDKPLAHSDGWAANLELLLATLPLARRAERVELASRYDLRVRESRIKPFADAMALYKFGRTVRGKRVTLPAPAAPSENGSGQRPPRAREQATS